MKRLVLILPLLMLLSGTPGWAAFDFSTVPVVFNGSEGSDTMSIYGLYRSSDVYRPLTGALCSAALSPDGRWLAGNAALSDQIWIVPANGQAEDARYICDSDDPDGESILELHFTPDSQSIIYGHLYSDESRGTVTTTTDTGSSTKGQLYAIEMINVYTGEHKVLIDGGSDPAISPDGRFLAYVNRDWRINTDESAAEYHGVPAVYDMLTGEIRYLLDEPDGVWSYQTPSFDILPWTGIEYSELMITPDSQYVICKEHDWDDGITRLVRIPVQGGEPEILQEECRISSHSSLSPNGKYIAFTQRTGVNDYQIYILNLADNRVLGLYDQPGFRYVNPRFSSDGKRLIFGRLSAFSANDEVCSQQIDPNYYFSHYEEYEDGFVGLPANYGMDPGYGTPLPSIDSINPGYSGEYGAVWASDGKSIAYRNDEDQIYLYNFDTEEARLIYSYTIEYNGFVLGSNFNVGLFGFSPDGNEIVFRAATVDESKGTKISLDLVNGVVWGYSLSDPVLSLKAVDIHTGAVRTIIDGAGTGRYSPDGKYFVFTVQQKSLLNDPMIIDHSLELSVMNLDTNEITFTGVKMVFGFTVSDDNLVYGATTGGSVCYNIETGEATMITEESLRSPSISPDGSQVLFTKSNGICMYDTPSGQTARYANFDAGKVYHVIWSPDGSQVLWNIEYEGRHPSFPTQTMTYPRYFIADTILPEFTDIPLDVASDVPEQVATLVSYPNPFNPSTIIEFTLDRESNVVLAVYNMAGQKVRELLSGSHAAAGVHSVQWDGRDEAGIQVSAGVYISRLVAGETMKTLKITLVK